MPKRSRSKWSSGRSLGRCSFRFIGAIAACVLLLRQMGGVVSLTAGQTPAFSPAQPKLRASIAASKSADTQAVHASEASTTAATVISSIPVKNTVPSVTPVTASFHSPYTAAPPLAEAQAVRNPLGRQLPPTVTVTDAQAMRGPLGRHLPGTVVSTAASSLTLAPVLAVAPRAATTTAAAATDKKPLPLPYRRKLASGAAFALNARGRFEGSLVLQLTTAAGDIMFYIEARGSKTKVGKPNTVVMNTRVSGAWQEEQYISRWPFKQGGEFTLRVLSADMESGFEIYVDGKRLHLFPYRTGSGYGLMDAGKAVGMELSSADSGSVVLYEVKLVEIPSSTSAAPTSLLGSVVAKLASKVAKTLTSFSLPLSRPLPNGLGQTSRVVVRGTFGSDIVMRLWHGAMTQNALFFLHARGNERKLVMNTQVGGTWQSEENAAGTFPLQPGKPFTLVLSVARGGFDLAINDVKQHFFPYRPGRGGFADGALAEGVHLSGDFTPESIAIENEPAQRPQRAKDVWEVDLDDDVKPLPKAKPPAVPFPDTIVTGYYHLKQSKPGRGHANYLKWSRDFLTIETPMVIYTDAESAVWIREARKSQAATTEVLVLDLDAIPWQKRYDGAFWARQRTVDPNRHTHHKGVDHRLFIIWDSKLHLVKQVIERNPFGSERFWWMDMGAVRDGQHWGKWPAPSKAAQIPRDRIAVNLWEASHACGGTWGGYADAILKWHNRFYKDLHRWAQFGRWIGRDEIIYDSEIASFPDKFLVLPGFQKLARCSDPWFSMWRWFSDSGCTTKNLEPRPKGTV